MSCRLSKARHVCASAGWHEGDFVCEVPVIAADVITTPLRTPSAALLTLRN